MRNIVIIFIVLNTYIIKSSSSKTRSQALQSKSADKASSVNLSRNIVSCRSDLEKIKRDSIKQKEESPEAYCRRRFMKIESIYEPGVIITVLAELAEIYN